MASERPVPIIEHASLDGTKFQNLFEQWPSGNTESSLHEWVPDGKLHVKSVRPEGVPPITGIKNIEVRAGAGDQVLTTDYNSTDSVSSWIENISSQNQVPQKDAVSRKVSNSELVLKPVGPETHSQQGFPRFVQYFMYLKNAKFCMPGYRIC